MALDNHPLKAKAFQLQSLIACAEFTDGQEQSIPYADGFQDSLELLKEAREQKAGVFLVGNGGSAAVVSHIFNDFINVARLRAFTLHESSLATCMANDYGYENIYSKVIFGVIPIVFSIKSL